MAHTGAMNKHEDISMLETAAIGVVISAWRRASS